VEIGGVTAEAAVVEVRGREARDCVAGETDEPSEK